MWLTARCVAAVEQSFERQHQMSTALRGGHRMDLVDDDRVDVDQGLGNRRCQHQVQALGCRDEQIDWVADQLLTLARRRVAGSHRHSRLDVGHPESFGGQTDPHQRSTEVLLDVEGQSAQRRDVQHAGALLRVWCLCRAQAVDRCEECRERLATAGRCTDKGVVAAEDRRPAIDLRCRRLGKRGREPGPHGRRERLQHRMVSHPIRIRQGCDTRFAEVRACALVLGQTLGFR